MISKDLDQMKATTTNDYSETSHTDCQSQLSNFQLVSCEELATVASLKVHHLNRVNLTQFQLWFCDSAMIFFFQS